MHRYEYTFFPPCVLARGAAGTVLLAPQALAAAGERVRFGMIGIGMQGSGLLGTAITLPGVECVGGRRPLRWPPHAGQGDHRESQSAHHPPLSGTAGPQGYRLHRGGGARPLAHARGGGRLQRGQGHLLRKAHVARRGAGIRNGGGGPEEQPHRADRVAARQFRAVRQGAANCITTAPSATWRWWSSRWGATIPPAPGNIRRRSIFRPPISIGTPG